MNYIFNIYIAKQFGVDESIFIQNVAYWMMQNKSNNVNFYDERYWTFNSQKAFTKLFPFWSRQNLRRVIDSCKKQGLLLVGNYNKLPYDRTNWYTLSDEGLKLFPYISSQQIDQTLGENQPRPWLEPTKVLVDTNPPIPDINTDNKQKIKDNKAQRKKRVDAIFDPLNIFLPDWLEKDLWIKFVKHRKEIKKPLKEQGSNMAIKKLEELKENGQDIRKVIEASIANGWSGLFEIKSQGDMNGKGNGSSKQKSDWQIDYFKRVLGGNLGFGTSNSGEIEINVSSKNEHQLQDRRGSKQSGNSLDESFEEYNTRRYIESLG